MSEPPKTHRLRLVIILGLLLAYAALSHYSNSNPNAKSLGATLSVGPLALIAIALVWRWFGRWVAVATAVAIGTIFYLEWSFLKNNFQWSDLIEQVGIYALMALGFARSLFGHNVPLCTQLAIQLHGPLAPVETTYCRRATWAWTFFYVALAASIAISFFLVSQENWSMYVNFGTFGLIAIACVIDVGLRKKMLPPRPGASLMNLLQRSLIG